MLKLQLYHEMYYVATPSIAELDAVLQEKAGDAEAYHLRGIANFQNFEFRAAAHDFSRAIELRPDFVDAIFHRGIVRVVRGRYNDAIEDFNRVIELQPDHAAAYYNRGRLHYWKGEYEAAIADFQKARKLDPLLGRELNLRYVIGELQRRPDDNSVLTQVQRIIDRLLDL
ncbi:MAG: tetratricopeptide repeat protein [Chloroflexi bacterium]|nr:MAG: tetratricopeptide repeat protein [Chloroflexota bacterium]